MYTKHDGLSEAVVKNAMKKSFISSAALGLEVSSGILGVEVQRPQRGHSNLPLM